MFFTLLLSLFLPVGLAIYFYRKYRFSLKAFFVGAAVFFLSQIVIRTPLLLFLSSRTWFSDLSGNLFFSAVIIGGLTAGLFEECGRYLGFRFILKRELSWKSGLAYGLGHGGIEAIILVGLTYINNIVISLMINSGAFDRFAAPQLGAEASLIKSQLVNLPAHIFAVAGVERALALIIQVALSLIVLYAVKRRRPLFLLAAILLHTVLNAGAVYLQAANAGVWLIELYIAAIAVASFYMIIKSRLWIDPPAPCGMTTGGGTGDGVK
ncbi:MAG TPA: YhfC family glutamic-type intramembrane protease [Bacillota bacterium]|nr:YhfC family glutamic-type intramembrane protease [Bacillota bacterium]